MNTIEPLEVCESRMIGKIDVEEITVRPIGKTWKVIAKLWNKKASNRDTLTQEEANEYAKLFAAAPDLLEALEGLQDMLSNHHGDDRDETPLIDKAFAAIAKARGL